MFTLEFFIGLALIGIVAGFASGLLGVGGGFLIVPLQYFLLEHVGVDPGLAMLVSLGTSLAIIIPTSCSTTWMGSSVWRMTTPGRRRSFRSCSAMRRTSFSSRSRFCRTHAVWKLIEPRRWKSLPRSCFGPANGSASSWKTPLITASVNARKGIAAPCARRGWRSYGSISCPMSRSVWKN